MLSRDNLDKFTKEQQTTSDNVVREYCQHLFLSYLYQQPGAERLLFKGGTALRIVFASPRFSEDLDFTGVGLRADKVESLFTDTLAAVEKTGLDVELQEGKTTSGGYLGVAFFTAYNLRVKIQIEVSLRRAALVRGTRALIASQYVPAYTLVHLPTDLLIKEKLMALSARRKPRDFYDYFFLLSGNFSEAKKQEHLQRILQLLRDERIDFRRELKKFLPASQASLLKNFSGLLERKITAYL